MYNVFNEVDKFFSSLNNYLNYNTIFLIFIGLFLLTIVFIIISTSHAYEARLIKAIDMFNNYFIDTPQITEENLVAFNAKMKHKNVPKQLRKQWQQFVLYREDKASHYMSFETCVSNPIKNSTYKRDITIMNILAYVFALCSLILNLYFSYELDLATVLQRVLLGPIIILLLNYLVTIFLDLRHNAIVSDLYQNYQYFEVNIDKATTTLPEYVDYEVLFDRNEIKKGIPILYAYLQKRAEEEQRELERARLKNVEHEKYNFDEAGVNGSLVLERAMQEAENYIAERKKYNQDTEQINSDITQEDMNYREITKEYNRQMQVSKETFANFKSQLEEASSSIEVNYLKKQQQQELDRQRNLERDFDTQTERHKKIIESYHAELDSVDNFRAESKKSLEDAMMSEFETYSSKVYDEVKKAVEAQEKEKYDKIKQEIRNLEERLVAKDKELENVYAQNQDLLERMAQNGIPQPEPNANYQPEPEYVEHQTAYNQIDQQQDEVQPQYDEYYANLEEQQSQEPVQEEQNTQEDFVQNEVAQPEEYHFSYTIPSDDNTQQNAANEESEYKFSYTIPKDDDSQSESISESDDDDLLSEEFIENETDDNRIEEPIQTKTEDDFLSGVFAEKGTEDVMRQEEPLSNDETLDLGEEEVSNNSTEQVVESVETPIEEKPRKKAGRPRKIIDESEIKPKRKVGRPRKEVIEVEEIPKKRPGRPRKEKVEEPKKKVGRPRKVEVIEISETPKKRPGRPKKDVVEAKKKVGRPRKTEVQEEKVAKKVGRPKKEVQVSEKKKVGRPKKETAKVPMKKRGRPRKGGSGSGNPSNAGGSSVDLDAYLKEISQAIAEENAKLEKTKQELAKKANISKKK